MATSAKVELDVHRAFDLLGLAGEGTVDKTSNPMATITIGGTSFSTTVQQGSLFPEWNQRFTFPSVMIPSALTINLYHKDSAMGTEVAMGASTLLLYDSNAVETKKNVVLNHGGNRDLAAIALSGCGSVEISYTVSAVAAPPAAAPSDIPPWMQDSTPTPAPAPIPAAVTPVVPEPVAAVAAPATDVVSTPTDVGSSSIYGSTAPLPQPVVAAAVDTPPATAAAPMGAAAVPQATVTPPVAAPPSFLSPELTSTQAAGAVPSFLQPDPSAVVAAIGVDPTSGGTPTYAAPGVGASPVTSGPGVYSQVQVPTGVVPDVGSIAPLGAQPVAAAASTTQPVGVPLYNPSVVPSTTPTPNSAPTSGGDQYGAAAAVPAAPTASSPTPGVEPLGGAPLPSAGTPTVPTGSFYPGVGDPVVPAAGVAAPPLTAASSGASYVSAAPLSARGSEIVPPPPSATIESKPTTPVTPVVPAPVVAAPVVMPVNSIPTETAATAKSVLPKDEGPLFKAAPAAPPRGTAPVVIVAPSSCVPSRPTTAEQQQSPPYLLSSGSSLKPPPGRRLGSTTSGAGGSIRRAGSKVRAPSSSAGSGGGRAAKSHTDPSNGPLLPTSNVAASTRKVKELYKDAAGLMLAALEGDSTKFEQLRAADPLLCYGFLEVKDYCGRTPLHLAAWHGHLAVLEAILKPVMDGSQSRRPVFKFEALTSNNGNTVLHSAAMGGDIHTMAWLLQNAKGIELNVQAVNRRGLTPIQAAREVGNQAVADLLARYEPSHLRPAF